jgi:hypothetical protein
MGDDLHGQRDGAVRYPQNAPQPVMLCLIEKKPTSAGFLLVRPAWDRSWRSKFSRQLIKANEVKRN